MNFIAAFTLAIAATLLPFPASSQPTALDPVFGTAGIAWLDEGRGIGDATLLPDGRLAVVGAPGTPLVVLDRFGRTDTAFRPVMPLFETARIVSVGATSDGKLVTLQEDTSGWPHVPLYVTRHTGNGVLDPTFGQEGAFALSRVLRGMGGQLALDSHDRILFPVASSAISVAGSRITRIGTSGTQAESLGSVQIYGPPEPWGYQAVRVQADGRPVAAFATADRRGPAVVRLDGAAPDLSFGVQGYAVAPQVVLTTDAAIAPDGSIVAAGIDCSAECARRDQLVIARFTPDTRAVISEETTAG